MDKFALITRNAEEVVTLDELKALLGTKKCPRAYVGYEPSGKIHMGHVLTVNKLIDLQNADFKIVVLLADVHAYLNEKGALDEIKEIAQYNKRCFIALGLDEKKTEFVFGSDFQLEHDYAMDVLKLARHTTLNRAKRSMDEISRSAENPKVSQMIYPLMQAIDITRLNVDVAVGGMDQRKIHMLAREGLPKLGFAPPTCIHTPILVGLDGAKMSSSKDNYISIDDSPEEIQWKIDSAFCPPDQVKNNPVLELFKYHIFPRFPEVIAARPPKFGGDVHYAKYEDMERDFVWRKIHPADLKKSAVKYTNEILDPVRKVLA
ncbi:MAG: tyrosine--tRNA ligase [Methanocellales archaeon]|nr:tyrosine--tRNA ligase [Methanocellales archaeon]